MWGRRKFIKQALKSAALCFMPSQDLEGILSGFKLPKPAQTDFFSLNITTPWWYGDLAGYMMDQQLAVFSDLNPGMLRLEAYSESAGKPREGLDFSITKMSLEKAKKAGFKTILLADDNIIPKSPLGLVNANDSYLDSYLEKIDYLAGYLGEFVDAWEIMNEPNNSKWVYDESGKKEKMIKPRQLAKLVAGSSSIIKSKKPEAKIVTGGLLNLQGHDARRISEGTETDPLVYLRQLLSYLPSDAFDAIGAHCYFEADKLQDHLQLYNIVSGWKKPIWVTEFGESSLDLTAAGYRSEEQDFKQADFLFQSYRQLSGLVPVLAWYKDVDDPMHSPQLDSRRGIYQADWKLDSSRKPTSTFKTKKSYFAYRIAQHYLAGMA